MTKEEADFIGGMNMCDEISNEAYKKIMCHCEEQETCEDAVSRKAVINQIYPILYFTDNNGNVVLGSALRERIARLPSVTPTQRWISVDKELPKENVWDDGYVEPSDYVLVWGDCGEYGVSRYWGNRQSKSVSPDAFKDWVDLNWVAEKPIAWMPLPPGYKGE